MTVKTKTARKLFTLAIALTLTLALITAIPTVSQANAAGANLLINPGAEEGMKGWVDPDNLWAAHANVAPHSGRYFFWPQRGPAAGNPPQRDGVPVSTFIYQDVPISAYAEGSSVTLSGWLCNYYQPPNDMATLILEFLNVSGSVIQSYQREHRNNDWTEYTIIAPIPAGAATARVKLLATRYMGYNNDGYFDDLSFTVSSTSVAQVYITGPTDKAKAGDSIQLTATNGTSSNA